LPVPLFIFLIFLAVVTREEQVPDPDVDKIVAVFYTYKSSEGGPPQSGIVVVEDTQLEQQRLRDVELEVVVDEFQLINKMIDIVVELDPDILVGWEVQRASWGYLNARGQHYGDDLPQFLL
jgi:DNA polymerase zeta